MTDLHHTAEPFDAGTFHERCPACGTCNRVQVTEQYGHNQPHAYSCAHCGQRLGHIKAAAPPQTSVVDDGPCARPAGAEQRYPT